MNRVIDWEIIEKDVPTSFQITGTSNDDMMFIWADKEISFPLSFGYERASGGGSGYNIEIKVNSEYIFMSFYNEDELNEYNYRFYNVTKQ